jgi:hypothetical protein
MKPLAVLITTSRREILHRCTACGLTRRNQLGEAEDEELVRRLGGEPLPGIGHTRVRAARQGFYSRSARNRQ